MYTAGTSGFDQVSTHQNPNCYTRFQGTDNFTMTVGTPFWCNCHWQLAIENAPVRPVKCLPRWWNPLTETTANQAKHHGACLVVRMNWVLQGDTSLTGNLWHCTGYIPEWVVNLHMKRH